MAATMMRVTDKLLRDLKLLKSINSVDGRLGSNNDIVQEIVNRELSKTHVWTLDGYATVGYVVSGPDNKVLVIESVNADIVVFRNRTHIINGSALSRRLEIISKSVSTYEGHYINE